MGAVITGSGILENMLNAGSKRAAHQRLQGLPCIAASAERVAQGFDSNRAHTGFIMIQLQPEAMVAIFQLGENMIRFVFQFDSSPEDTLSIVRVWRVFTHVGLFHAC